MQTTGRMNLLIMSKYVPSPLPLHVWIKVSLDFQVEHYYKI